MQKLDTCIAAMIIAAVLSLSFLQAKDAAFDKSERVGPITTLSANQLPKIGHIPGGPAARESAWAPGTNGFLPTNDWFQTLAGYPNQPAPMNSSGFYMLQWTGEKDGSLRFRSPVTFTFKESAQPAITQHFDDGFTIGASGASGRPVVYWEETGNMARHVTYNDGHFIIPAVQGTLFQGAMYRDMVPSLTVPANGTMTKTSLADDVARYEIDANQRKYLIYGNSTLTLTYNPANGKLTSAKPYTGNINVASVNQMADPHLLDTYANVVIVKAQGTLLPNYQYQFSYVTEDLRGHATTLPPLVLFKQHQINNLKRQQSTGMTETTLTGNMEAYVGSHFVFEVPVPSQSQNPLDIIPTLPNGNRGITIEQAKARVNDNSAAGLENALLRVVGLEPLETAYNKTIYQQGLTLAYAQAILEMLYPDGNLPQKYRDAMDGVYQAMKAHLKIIFRNLRYDSDYGTIVASTNDYGNHSHYNDHIAQYSYTLYALTFMKQYADKYATTDPFFTAPIFGLPYTGKEMGDLLASDIGETGPGGHNPLMRNFDVYQSHSWLSGTGASPNGGNIESQSEAVFGGLTVAAWLAATQPDSLQEGAAETRWAMEAQGLQTYFLIDPETSVYKKVSPKFVTAKTNGKLPPVVSMLWENRITSATYWGSEWDRQLACEFMPAGANLMDSYLENMSHAYQKLVADYILHNWDDYDQGNRIQSVLIPVVAKAYPEKVTELIKDVVRRNRMDKGTNAFLLRVIGDYALNSQGLTVPSHTHLSR